MNQMIVIIILLLAAYFIFKLICRSDDKKSTNQSIYKKNINMGVDISKFNIKTQPHKYLPARITKPLRVDMPKFYTKRIPPVMIASPNIY